MIKCPICFSDSKMLYSLPSDYLKKKLNDFYHTYQFNELKINDYEMRICENCSLIFANPLIPGDNNFYNLVTKQNNYYTKFRWEYGKVMEIINKNAEKIILDIGCGDGYFLELLKNEKNIRGIGIDTTETSINICKHKGLEGYCTDLKKFIISRNTKDNKLYFDYVVAFHLLEHISDPLGFMEDVKKILKPGGKILISTPLSPMSFEYSWFDPLNNPPHHMTRWSVKSYQKLATKLKMNVTFYLPTPNNILNRIASSYSLVKYNKVKQNKYIIFLIGILLNPFLVFKIFLHQIKREKFKGKTLPDLILVEFSNNNIDLK